MVILQVERGHTILKLKLGVLIDDFLTVIININFLFWNQHQTYIIAFEK